MTCLRCGQSKEAHCRADGATPGGACAGFVVAWPADEIVEEAPVTSKKKPAPEKG